MSRLVSNYSKKGTRLQIENGFQGFVCLGVGVMQPLPEQQPQQMLAGRVLPGPPASCD